MLATSIVIKICFKYDKKLQSKKKNMISFNSLNMLYCVWILLTAIPSCINYFVENKGTLYGPFVSPVAVNALLISFLVKNEEAWKYFKMKLENWKNLRKVNQTVQDRLETNKSKWAIMSRTQRRTDRFDQNGDIFLVDIEHLNIM